MIMLGATDARAPQRFGNGSAAGEGTGDSAGPRAADFRHDPQSEVLRAPKREPAGGTDATGPSAGSSNRAGAIRRRRLHRDVADRQSTEPEGERDPVDPDLREE